MMDEGKTTGFGTQADHGTTGTTISELGQEDNQKEEQEYRKDLRQLTIAERVEVLKER